MTRIDGTMKNEFAEGSETAKCHCSDFYFLTKLVISFLGSCWGNVKMGKWEGERRHKKTGSHRYERNTSTSKYQREKHTQQCKRHIQKDLLTVIILNNLFDNINTLSSKIPETSNRQEKNLDKPPEDENNRPPRNVPAVTMAFPTPYFMPLPNQDGPPYFDGQNVTRFLKK